jgi:hypothetical protein
MAVTDFAALAGRIAADPGFGSAAAALCRQVLDFYASRPPAMRLLGDQGQMRVMVACRYLDPDITLAAVQKLVPAHVASPNRVAAALALMKRDRALLACDGRDRRTRRYRLSEEGLALADAFLTMMVAAGAPFADRPVRPDRSRAWAEDFLLATMERGGGIKSGPEAERGQTLKGGALLNLELMRRGLEPGDTSRFSRRGFAARFGLSRAQVIALLGALEHAGWATLSDGRLQPTPLAMEGGQLWLSRFLAISTAVLDERFLAIAAVSREQARAAQAAARSGASVA